MYDPSYPQTEADSFRQNDLTSKNLLLILLQTVKAMHEPDKYSELTCSDLIIRSTDPPDLVDPSQLANVIQNKLISRLQKKADQRIGIDHKSQFFASCANILPSHYFERPPIVRIIWELWASIRDFKENFQLLEEDFILRMLLLQQGLLRVSKDLNDYPIHKALFERTFSDIIELAENDTATMTSL